jgi:hypothetical protein
MNKIFFSALISQAEKLTSYSYLKKGVEYSYRILLAEAMTVKFYDPFNESVTTREMT